MSQQELADKMGISKSEISYLLNQHRNITAEIAVMLEKVLDIEAEFWMNLRMKYDVDIARKKVRISIDKAKISPAKKPKPRAQMANMKKKKKSPIVKIDNSLEQYKNKVLFPDKLAKANEMLRTVGIPNLHDKKPQIKSRIRKKFRQ